LLVSLMPLGAMFGSAMGGWASDRWSQRSILMFGSIGALSGFGVLTIVSWLNSIQTPIVLVAAAVATCGFMIGFVLPAQLKLMIDYYPDIRGTASGISIFARFMGATLAPVLCGYLADQYGLAVGFGSGGILLVIGVVVTAVLVFDLPAKQKMSMGKDLSIERLD
jgi:POT family proton-dependent oligopeptide transporter